MIMKKTLALILAVCLCLLLAAPASAAGDQSPFVGSWKLYAQEGAAPMTHEELLSMAAMGFDMANSMIFTFRGDGTMTVNVFGETADGEWTDNGDGTGSFGMEGEFFPMTVMDGFLRLDMGGSVGVFEQTAQSSPDVTMDNLLPLLEQFADSYVMPEMPEENVFDSRVIGEWRFYSMESDNPEMNVPHEALPALLEQGRDYAGRYTLSFRDDGWFKFCDFYGYESNNWSINGNDTGALFADGGSCEFSIEDDLLVLRWPDHVIRYEKTVPVGTTGYHIVVPADYTAGQITEEWHLDDMVGYYCSEKYGMDIDIYQFAADGMSLKDYAALEAKKYGAKNVENHEINGIPFLLYISDEEYDGVVYRVANVLFEAGDDFAELCFWMNGEENEQLAGQIFSSLYYVAPEPEDVHGVVVMKLEGDFFPDRYQVLGDDGELYEGEYLFGFEDLEPGTGVILSWRHGEWSLDLDEDPWASFDSWTAEYEEPLYTSDGEIIL